MEQCEFRPFFGAMKGRAGSDLPHKHSLKEIATCETFGEAMRLAQIHSRTKAYEIARLCGVRKSLVSAWQNDSRTPNPRQFLLYMSATGSLAPLQWLNLCVNGDLAVEPRKALAALTRVRAEFQEAA